MQRNVLALVLLLSMLSAAVAALAGPAGSTRSPHAKSITKGLDCSACHGTQSWQLLGGGTAGRGGFDHGRTGFPLTGRHRHVACTDCHTGERRVTRDCRGCHEDVHDRRLGQACDSCHSATGWRSVRALEKHRMTRLPLTGMHALLDCTQCHQRTTDRQWSSAPADCFACHAKDYRRPDLHPPHTGVAGDPAKPPYPRDCAQCHRATGWSPAFLPASSALPLSATTGNLRAHDARFPLSFGRHRGASCTSCHGSLDRPKLVRCDGCHAHSTARLRRQHRRVPGAQGSCLGCHPGGARR